MFTNILDYLMVASRAKIIRTTVVVLILVGLAFSLFPTDVRAGLTDLPTAWSNLVWQPYLYNGNPVYDHESSSDPSNGGTAVQPSDIDISSGASGLGPGTQPSVFLAYYDGGTPGDAAYSDDFYAFRVRLNANPEFKDGYGSRHWDVIMDIDGDGYKEFVVDLSGDFSQNGTDRLFVFYNNLDQQTYNPATDQVAEFVSASTNLCPPNCPVQTYNHTRVVSPATGGSDPNEVWLDFQIPITALKNGAAVQQVYPSTMVRLFYSTSASNTDPLQKDWMRTPFDFGDPLNPNVEATKTDSLFNDADGSGGYSPGDTILYTIVITNTGNLDANSVTFSDSPDINTPIAVGSVTTSQGSVTSGNNLGDANVAVNVGTVASGGGSVTITFKVTISTPLPPGVTLVSNQGTVSGINIATEPTDDPDTGTDDDATTISLSQADLAISKTVNNPNPLENEIITYTIKLTNSGPSTATNIQVTDILPVGVTYQSDSPSQGSYNSGTGIWSVGSLVNAASATLTITATVDTGTGGSTITNTAAIAHVDQYDPHTGDNSDSAVIYPIEISADLSLIKTVNNATPNTGDAITYTITVTNSGPDTATNIQVTDLLPAGGVTYQSDSPSQGSYNSGTGIWSVGSLVNAASATLTITATVDTGTGGSTITNTASITDVDQEDPHPGDNSDSAGIYPIEVSADLFLTKAVSDPTPMELGTITYTITVTNSGPDTATNIQLTDLLPTGVTYQSDSSSQGSYNSGTGIWGIGSLANAASAKLSITVTVDPGSGGSTITNTAEVTAVDQYDPDSTPNNHVPSEDDQDSDDITVTPSAGVALDPAAKADSLLVDADGNGQASPGDTLLYTVTVWNEGTADATGVVFNDTPDPYTTLVAGSVATTKGAVIRGNNPGDTWVEVSIGTLLAGGPASETVTISFHVTINDPLPAGVTHIYNQGVFTSNEAPPAPTDDPDTAPDDDSTGTPLGGPGPGPPGPPSGIPVFPNIYIGIAAAFGAGVIAYLIRKRVVRHPQNN
jgi:uncharacterized repeat protein (TIGR01451 family)